MQKLKYYFTRLTYFLHLKAFISLKGNSDFKIIGRGSFVNFYQKLQQLKTPFKSYLRFFAPKMFLVSSPV